MARWTLHHGDCLEWLRTLPSASVDALITDPPYSSGGAFRGDRMADTDSKYTQAQYQGRNPSFDGDTRDQRSFAYWEALVLSECLRIVRPGGVCAVFTDWRQLPSTTDAVQAGGWVWRGIAVWDKSEGVRPQKGRFRSQSEYVVWGSRGPMPLDRSAPVLPGVLRSVVRQDDKHHQTGKPTEVMRWLARFCERGGVILDPFAGSGTTGVGALLEGYSFVGCEKSPEYFNIACKRLAAAERGETIVRSETTEPKTDEAQTDEAQRSLDLTGP